MAAAQPIESPCVIHLAVCCHLQLTVPPSITTSPYWKPLSKVTPTTIIGQRANDWKHFLRVFHTVAPFSLLNAASGVHESSGPGPSPPAGLATLATCSKGGGKPTAPIATSTTKPWTGLSGRPVLQLDVVHG